MKRIIVLFLAVCIFISVPSVLASSIPADRTLPRVVDRADILTDNEEEALLSKLNGISERIGCDVAAVTVNSLNGKSAQAYADDFYDYNGYGMGSGDHGVLFLIAMDEREWAFSTYGLAIDALPRYTLESIAYEIIPDLSDGDYYSAIALYADLAAKNIEHYTATGTVMGGSYGDNYYYDDDYYYDDGFYYDDELTVGEKLMISLGLGAVVSLIIMLVMKSGMKTVRSNNFASPYIVDGSMSLTESRDLYLYRNVTRVRRENESSSSRGGMGGGVHRSSSGRSHGGASGRF